MTKTLVASFSASLAMLSLAQSKILLNYPMEVQEKTKEAEKIKYPVWVGEWALGTDACAFWLDGFNDSKTPRTDECMWVECPKTYLPDDVAVDMDRTAYM